MRITKLFLAVAVIVIAFASCEKSQKDLTNVIPSNAAYITHINTKSLIEKSDYDIFENVTVVRGINMAKGLIGKKEAVDMLDALTKDVNALGLDLKNDCFIYSDYSTFGLVLGMNDAEKFKNALVNFSMPEDMIKQEDGVYILSPTSSVVFSWTKDKFLILGELNAGRYYRSEDADDVDLVALAKKQLKQGEKESINSNPSFSKFMKEKKDISFFVAYTDANLDFFEKMSNMDLPSEIVEEFKQLKGIASVAYVSFEKGEIKSENKVYYDTPEVEKKYKDITTQVLGELKGDQLKSIPSSALFVSSFNLKGEGLYNYLDQLKLTSYINEQDKEGIFKTVMNEISGDVTIALTNVIKTKKSYTYGNDKTYEYDSTEPEFVLMIDCKDGNKALDFVKTTFPNMEDNLTQVDATTYSMEVNGMEQYFGTQNNTMFLTNAKPLFDNIKSKASNSGDYSKLAKGNAMIIAGDIKPLKGLMSELDIRDEKVSTIANDFISLFDVYSFSVPSNAVGTAHGKVEMVDKNQNSLAAICKFFDNTLTSLNDQIGF